MFRGAEWAKIGNRFRTILFLFFLLLAIPQTSFEAYLEKIPIVQKQPNGEILSLFASGDEYYNWAHDAQGFTIIRHPLTGFWVYAKKIINDQFEPSDLIAGYDSPAQHRIIPRLILPQAARLKMRNTLRSYLASSSHGLMAHAPQRGVLNNLVIFIRFSDDPEFSGTLSDYEAIFNSSDLSVRNYYAEASYNSLGISTFFFPDSMSGLITSYQDKHPRAYYQPYSSANPLGYGVNSAAQREVELLKSAIGAVRGQIPSNLIVDSDGDGDVDNVCFIVSGSPDSWNSLLWPHESSLDMFNMLINGKRVANYELVMETTASVGILSHEIGHALGFPDLYHYNNNGMEPVGEWDVMAKQSFIPQHMCAYLKHRYAGWISEMPEIKTAGTYTLNPLVLPHDNCFRLASPNSTQEFFVVEYRRREGFFESQLPGEGLLVYRINTSKDGKGNSNGPPDEIYLYRRFGTLTSDGLLDLAPLRADWNRTAINDYTNPASFLSDGSAGGLNISRVDNLSETLSFYAEFTPAGPHLFIQGKVTDARSGTPLVNVEVSAVPEENGSAIPTFTDANGEYRFFNLDTGFHYRLFTTNSLGYTDMAYGGYLIYPPPMRNGIGALLTLSDSSPPIRVDFPLPPAAEITGRLFDAHTQDPLPGQTVILHKAYENSSAETLTNESGQYSFKSLPPDSFRLETSNSAGFLDQIYLSLYKKLNWVSYGSIINLLQGERKVIDFNLDKGGSISGRITDIAAGIGIGGSIVTFYSFSPSDFRFLEVDSAQTDEAGHYLSPPLPPGTYYVQARKDYYIAGAYRGLQCAAYDMFNSTPVRVVLNQTTSGIDIALLNMLMGSSIQGVVRDTETGEIVHNALAEFYDSAGKWVGATPSSIDGLYSMWLIRPGDYFIKISASGYLPQLYPNIQCVRCEVTQGKSVHLEGEFGVEGINFNLIRNPRSNFVLPHPVKTQENRWRQ